MNASKAKVDNEITETLMVWFGFLMFWSAAILAMVYYCDKETWNYFF